jgi:hypothetical protein
MTGAAQPTAEANVTDPFSTKSGQAPARPPGLHTVAAVRPEADFIIRPAAVINMTAARELVAWLNANSIEKGGVWNVGTSTGIWQRYDKKWGGPFGARGDSQLVGTVYVTYDKPRQHEVVIHRVQITDHGLMLGWTSTKLVDEALRQVGLDIDSCPRDESLPSSYGPDPFRQADAYRKAGT